MKPFRSQFNLARTLAIAALSLAVGLLTAAEIASPFEAAAVATDKSPHVDSKHQFVLIDTLVRFVPAARVEEKFPGADDPCSFDACSGRSISLHP